MFGRVGIKKRGILVFVPQSLKLTDAIGTVKEEKCFSEICLLSLQDRRSFFGCLTSDHFSIDVAIDGRGGIWWENWGVGGDEYAKLNMY